MGQAAAACCLPLQVRFIRHARFLLLLPLLVLCLPKQNAQIKIVLRSEERIEAQSQQQRGAGGRGEGGQHMGTLHFPSATATATAALSDK